MKVKGQITEILRVCADDEIICPACPHYDTGAYGSGTAACYQNLMLEAADAIESQKKRIAELEAALQEQAERRWIPVTEMLPESNMPVLVYCTNITIQGGYTIHIGSCDMGKFWFLRTQPGIASFPVREWQVTHWMPLPEPPKGE